MKKVKSVKKSGQELHEIKNKKRLRPVKDKKRGMRLKRVSRRKTKAIVSVSLVGVLGFGIFFLGALGNPEKNVVDPGFETVSLALPEDGSTPDQHTGIENIGYMNTRFMSQPHYYSEMHSTVNSIMSQTVDTYKQYSNGILIQLDIAKSSLINEAQQFCWTDSDVLWRTTSKNVASWTGIDMPWTDFDLQHRTINDFVYVDQNGLPGTSFSVYVLREETVLEAEPVVVNDDGTYSQTFLLDPARDKAPAHYGNQMVFKGGLSAPPSFDSIQITYTFDDTWQVLSSEVEEHYTATKAGIPIPAGCVANTVTTYSYDPEKAQHTAYDEYFINHLDTPITEISGEKQLTAVECLGAAFGKMLSEPTSLSLAVDVGGYTLGGVLSLDVATMDIRADFMDGALRFWYSDGEAYLSYGGIKIKLKMEELLALFGGTPFEAEGGAGEFSLDSILADLSKGEFVLGENTASLSSTLDLSAFIGIKVPVTFSFIIGEEQSVELDKVQADLAFGDAAIKASMSFCDSALPDLSQEDKSDYIDFAPYLEYVMNLAGEDVLAVSLSYRGDDFSLDGGVNLSFTNGFAVAGEILLGYRESQKEIAFAYCGETVYLDFDGIRLKANVTEAYELLGGSESLFGGKQAAYLLRMLFSEEFLTAFNMAEQSQTLMLSVKTTQILELLGISLGIDHADALLSVSQGSVSLTAGSAAVTVSKGEAFSFDADGYIDILPYVNHLVGLFTGEALDISVVYESGTISLNGTLSVLLGGNLQVRGEVLIVCDGAEIPVSFCLADGDVYLDVYGLKVKAELGSLTALFSDMEFGASDSVLGFVKGLMSAESFDWKEIGGAVSEILTKLFDYETDELISVSESYGALNVELNAAGLIRILLGTDMELGNIFLAVAEDSLSVEALGGLKVVVTPQEAFKAPVPDDYADITELLPIFASGGLSFGGAVELSFDDTVISVEIRNGGVSWTDGFKLALDLLVGVNGVKQEIALKADTSSIQIAYGSVGVNLAFEEFDSLQNAFESLYETLKSVINGMFNEGKGPVPATVTDLMTQLAGMLQANGLLSADLSKLGLGSLIKCIGIVPSEFENGICHISISDLLAVPLHAEVIQTAEGMSLQLCASGGKFALSATMNIDALKEDLPLLPAEVTYLQISEFVTMLDYVGAAVETLAQNDFVVTVSVDTVGTEEGNSISAINGTILYHTGGDALFKINTENTTLTVTTNLYLSVSLAILSEESSTYLDLLIFDYNDDSELDFFVTLSAFDSENEKYNPLKIYASASEIMTTLSAGLSVFGVTPDLLNEYVIEKWLSFETTQQLLAFGDTLGKSMGLENGIFGLFSSSEKSESKTEVFREAFIRSIQANDSSFTVTLNSAALYGIEGLNDVVFQITKGENGLVTGVTLDNLYKSDGSNVTNVRVTVSTDEIAEEERMKPQTLEGYFDLSGIGALIKMLANTATHEEIADGDTAYVMNPNFYIDGGIALDLSLIGIIDFSININFAASVDLDKDDGSVLIKVQLNYPAFGKLGQVAINGDSQLDLDIDLVDNIVYMRRIQTSVHNGWTNKQLSEQNYIIEYRAMPLNIFFADILNQLGFIMNFGSLITKYLPENLESSGESEAVDYGTTLKTFLSGFRFDGNEQDGCSWTITLNGAALTGGTLQDIVLTLATDGAGMTLRTLGIATKIDAGTSALKINLSANLSLRNPKGVMDEGVTDNVYDISSDLKDAIGKAFNEAETTDWLDANGKYIYISGVLTTVTFMVDEEIIPDAEQSVLYDGKTYELYAELKYPDLSEYEKEGCTLIWEEIGDRISPNQIISAYYTPNLYDVRFVSSEEILGWDFDQATGVYYYDTQMDYGSSVDLYAGDDDLLLTYYVSVDGNMFELPFIDGRVWMQADIYQDFARFTSYGIPDKVTYVSAIDFTYDGITYSSGYVKNFEKDYTLFEADKISAEYTFLGWYMQTENGWVSVENLAYSEGESAEYVVEALWQSSLLNVDSVDFNRSGTWNYTNTVTVNITECELFGAWASDGSVTKKTVYDYTITGTTVGVKLTGQTESATFSVKNSFNIMYWAAVTATTTYTTSDGRVIYSESSQGSN